MMIITLVELCSGMFVELDRTINYITTGPV